MKLVPALSIPLAAAALTVALASPASAHPVSYFDVDRLSAATTGASASGTVLWSNYRSGTYDVAVRDDASDGVCAHAWFAVNYTDGSTSGWIGKVSACGSGRTAYQHWDINNVGKSIANLRVLVTRGDAFQSWQTTWVQPGGG